MHSVDTALRSTGMAYSVERIPGQRPICGQCRRDMHQLGGKWRHPDGTFRCEQGTLENVAVYSAAIAAAGGHSVWIGDGRPRWQAQAEA